jgi:hypothetical protein
MIQVKKKHLKPLTYQQNMNEFYPLIQSTMEASIGEV